MNCGSPASFGVGPDNRVTPVATPDERKLDRDGVYRQGQGQQTCTSVSGLSAVLACERQMATRILAKLITSVSGERRGKASSRRLTKLRVPQRIGSNASIVSGRISRGVGHFHSSTVPAAATATCKAATQCYSPDVRNFELARRLDLPTLASDDCSPSPLQARMPFENVKVQYRVVLHRIRPSQGMFNAPGFSVLIQAKDAEDAIRQAEQLALRASKPVQGRGRLPGQ